eukprot:SAG31_NODE_8234_length_1492_cov_1.934673_1_plen_496_part_11
MCNLVDFVLNTLVGGQSSDLIGEHDPAEKDQGDDSIAFGNFDQIDSGSGEAQWTEEQLQAAVKDMGVLADSEARTAADEQIARGQQLEVVSPTLQQARPRRPSRPVSVVSVPEAQVTEAVIPSEVLAVVATSNQAINAFSETLQRHGMLHIVCGNASRMKKCAWEHTLEYLVDQDEEVTMIKKELDAITITINQGLEQSQILPRFATQELEQRLKQSQVATALKILQRSSVILSTIDSLRPPLVIFQKYVRSVCFSSKDRDSILSRSSLKTLSRSFSTVIIDEASTVAETNIPVLLDVGPKRLIFVGDKQQLPPFSHRVSVDHKLTRSFMERMLTCCSTKVFPMLTENHRMVEPINALMNLFYGGKVKACRQAGTEVSEPLRWHNVAGVVRKNGKSLYNLEEITKVKSLYTKLQEEHPKKRILIITFYKEQYLRLKEELTSAKTCNIFITLATVDASQGSQADIVILSIVGDSVVGHLADVHRLCVSMSRASLQLN